MGVKTLLTRGAPGAFAAILCATSAQARFLQPDPLGYASGPNLYAYVGNDPLNNTDPNGECVPYCVTVPVGAAIGVAGAYFADPQHFTWQAAAAGAFVGGLAGALVPQATAFVGPGAGIAATLARAGVTAGGGFIAGTSGAFFGSTVTGQPVRPGQALLIGGLAAGATVVSGEAAVAGLATGLSPAGSAALSAYMAATSAIVAIPGAYVITNAPVSSGPQFQTFHRRWARRRLGPRIR